MNALNFQLQLKEPVIIGQTNIGDPNSSVGLNFIPGSTIRGAVVNKFLAGRTIDAADEEFRRLFLNGMVCFLNAYPISKSGQRTLPTPLSWRKEKDVQNAPIWNFAMNDQDLDLKRSWMGLTESFCFLARDEEGIVQVELVDPEMEVKLHISRKKRQALKEENSTIFRYQALSGKQRFSGAIISSDLPYLEKIKEILSASNNNLNLGKSHLAGYGKVTVENVKIEENWYEYQLIGEEEEKIEDKVLVTFLSDAIIRDEVTGADAVNPDQIVNCSHHKAFAKSTISGGFNRTWNMPIPQRWVIKAGSVFIYNSNPTLYDHLKQLEKIGIGERKVEGFGRIAIDWNNVDNIPFLKKVQTASHQIAMKSENRDFARRMVNNIYIASLDQMLIQKVNTLTIQKPPHRAQLGNLRAIFRDAFHKQDLKLIGDYLSNFKRPAETQFQNARVGPNSLKNWIFAMIKNPTGVWDLLEVQRIKKPSIGGVTPELTTELAFQYTIRVIDGILHKTLKGGVD